jgi:radical SAM superfamily enzyme YgiQ (UPF0313 family)
VGASSVESPEGHDVQTTIHLISMPLCKLNRPSIQLGALKAYIDGAGLGVSVYTYSAFLGILVLEPGSTVDPTTAYFERVDTLEAQMVVSKLDPETGAPAFLNTGVEDMRNWVGDAPYFVLYYRKYLAALHPDLVEDKTNVCGGLVAFRVPEVGGVLRMLFGSRDGLRILGERTDAYIESRIIPQLSRTGLNVVGFTCTFDQIYASVYCYRYLRERCPDVRFLFVFGGSSIGLPRTQELLQTLGIDALCVVGEGEAKLEAIVKHCSSAADDTLPSTIRVDVPGVVHVTDPIDYYEKQDALYDGQIEKLDHLPTPDYDEYFDLFRERCTSAEEYRTAKRQVELPLEGSRGCVFHCTFCNLNYLWDGYRSQTAAKILECAADVMKKYGEGDELKLRYADNLANWSASVAQVAVDRNIKFPALLELRAKYPEEFWVKLDRIGVLGVQVGIEAYSSALLALMEKKTRAIDNVRAHKYMDEVGMRHGSNLIARYPRSTLEMVEESRRVCGYITHFSKLSFSMFELVQGSPLYNRLSPEARRQLIPVGVTVPSDDLARYAWGYAFAPPPELVPPPEITEAWLAFETWYVHATKAKPRFTVERVGETRRLTDTRSGAMKQTVVAGPAARVLDACHKPSTIDEIAEITALGLDVIHAAIAELAEARALLPLDGEYITVALRPKAELIAAFENTRRSKPRPAALNVVQP